MIKIILRQFNESTYRADYDLLLATLLLFLYRVAIPLFKYPFIVLFVLFLIFAIIKFKSKIIEELLNFISLYILTIILFCILLINFLLSSKLFLVIFKDIFSSVILIILVFFISLFVKNKVELKYFLNRSITMIIFFTTILIIYELLNFFFILPNYDLSYSTQVASGYLDNEFHIDSNFSILFNLFGILCVLSRIFFTISSANGIYNLLLTLFSIGIIFSGSRRGVVILLFIVALLIIIQFFRLDKTKLFLNNVAKQSSVYLISFFGFFVLLIIYSSVTSYDTKNKILEIIGSKNINETRIKIANVAHRYCNIIDNSLSYRSVYDIIWKPVFDPKDPDSTWGLRIHKTVFPLIGENVEIVPVGTKGYLMDHKCNASIWGNNAYSYTQLLNKKVTKTDTINASVFCYVSKDFDGDWVSLYSDGTAIGVVQTDYDLKRKGEWQKLNLNYICNPGEIFIQLIFSKTNSLNFSDLLGYVVFAYPQISINGETINILSSNSVSHNHLNVTTDFSEIEYACFIQSQTFSLKGIAKHFSYFPQGDDAIRKWAALLIQEDTAYIGFRSNISATISENPISLRTSRWEFALKIFRHEYSITQKLFGGGFNFLNWYGYYFLKDKTASDWPHNPFLSILLYSGVFGLLIYCFFLYKVFYYYIKYIKEYPLLFIFFLITFFFNFFSGGSPFDHPIMGFFSILPFFIHSVHKREKEKELALSKSEDTAS